MSTALKPLITKAGLAAIWNATSTGVQAEIAYIGLGSQGTHLLSTRRHCVPKSSNTQSPAARS